MTSRTSIFSTSETAYAVDHEGRIVAWNEAAEHTFGFTQSEALGKECWSLLSGRDIFGNKSCCEGCPVRASAFNNELVNRFQIDFKTAANEFERFAVSTVMLIDSFGKKSLVHLCRPGSDVNDKVVTDNAKTNPTVQNRRGILTPREIEVITLLDKGKSVAEIASLMGISVSTVRNHTQHVLTKLNAHTRLEAVALGRKLGLI